MNVTSVTSEPKKQSIVDPAHHMNIDSNKKAATPEVKIKDPQLIALRSKLMAVTKDLATSL